MAWAAGAPPSRSTAPNTASKASDKIDGFSDATGRRLAPSEPDVRSEIDLSRHVGQCQRIHDALAQIGQLSFGRVVEPAIRDVGDRPAEHRIAEELQPLVALVTRMLRAPGPVIERSVQQLPIGESMADALLQRAEIAEIGSGHVIGRSGCCPIVDVIDGVAHGLQVFEILVLDPEAGDAARQLLLERFDQFDQGQRVGIEVVDERLTLGDPTGLDLEDVGEAIADDFEDLVAADRAVLHGGV